ncbi:MAG: hypothetical protein RSC93_03135 [Erysipelotrichaceae bacterium]
MTKGNVVTETEEIMKIIEERLNINLGQNSIINKGEIGGFYISDLVYALGKNNKGHKNARNNKEVLNIDEAIKENIRRVEEISQDKVNFLIPQATVGDYSTIEAIRKFCFELIEYCKSDNILNFKTGDMEKFVNDFFPKIQKNESFVFDGNTMCQTIENIYNLVQDGYLTMDRYKKLARLYKEEKLKVVKYSKRIFETSLDKKNPKYNLEYGFKVIQLINLVAKDNYKSWSSYTIEVFYLNIIKFMCAFLHKNMKDNVNYSTRNLLELLSAAEFAFLPKMQKCEIDIHNLSHANLLTLKALTNQKAGQKNSGENVLTDETDYSLNIGFFDQKCYRNLLNSITTSFLRIDNLTEGLAHVREWSESLLRLQHDTKYMTDFDVPSSRDRNKGISRVFENTNILEKHEVMEKMIQNNASPLDMHTQYIQYEELIKEYLKEFYAEKDKFNLSKLKSELVGEDIGKIALAITESNDVDIVEFYTMISRFVEMRGKC